MPMRSFRSSPIVIQLADSTDQKKKIQVMRCGKFHSPQYGDFEITKTHLLSMKKNFDAGVRGIDLAVDYKHESDDVAAGWFKDIYLSEDGTELWAEVDWTPNGQKVLADKEFRYISADFSLEFVHNETKQKHGPTLFGAGLTNRPFIKDMNPVVELSEGNKKMDEKDKKIAELEAQIAELKKNAGGSGNAEMEEMKKKLAAYEANELKAAEEKKLAEKKGQFDKLLTEGKACEAQRESFMSGDAMKFAELAQPVNLKGNGSSTNPPPGSNGEVKTQAEAEAAILKLAEDKVKEKKAGDISEGIKMVLSENSDLRKKYYQE